MSKTEIIKKRNEVIKALGASFRETFKMTIPAADTLRWIVDGRCFHGELLVIPSRVENGTDLITAELSWDAPSAVTYERTAYEKSSCGRSSYVVAEV